jgi:acyl carrier protein
MDKIRTCLKNVFPRCDEAAVKADTLLGTIPGWDSMNSLNVLLELEGTFSVDLQEETLSGKQHVSDIVEMLRRRGAVI